MKRSRILLAAILTLAALLRLLPAYTSGTLFSVDVWPLYRSSQRLLEIPEARIWNNSLFDGYNNRWPGVILSAALYSKISGVPIDYVYMHAYTAVCSLVTLTLVYALLRRFMNAGRAAASAAFFGFVPSLLVFTSSPLKEVYSYASLYSILLIVSRPSPNVVRPEDLAALLILGVGLALSHHLATLILVGFLLSTAYVLYVQQIEEIRSSPSRVYARLFLSSLVVGLTGLAYFYFYGSAGLKVPIALEDILLYIVYAVPIYGGYLLSAGFRRTVFRELLSIVLIGAASALAALLPRALPGISMPPASVFWYVIPIAAALPLASVRVDGFAGALVSGLGLFILLNAAYILFGKPLLASIVHRFLNYAALPLSIMVGFSLGRKGLPRVYSYAVVLLAFISSLAVLSNLVGGGIDASYFWYYTRCECSTYDALNALADGSATIVGDDHVQGYYSMVRTVEAFRYLLEVAEARKPPDTLVVAYSANYRVGLSIGLNIYKLPPEVVRNVYSRILDSGCVQVFK